MTVPLWHLRSRGPGPDRTGDPAGQGAFPDGGEPQKPAKASRTDMAFRTADLLGYGQRGKVTTTSFPARRRGLSSILTARSIPVLAAFAEFGLVAGASFAAGALYHHTTLGHLPSAQ